MELEEKRLQWFGHVKRMDGTRATRTLEFKFKGGRRMGDPEEDGSAIRRGKSVQ
jgi:hypothetical protein